MAKPRAHLPKAPIVEALFDFRVLQNLQTSPDCFANLATHVGAQYSQVGPLHSIQARFGFDQGRLQQPESRQSIMGWLYKAEHEIAQFRLDGFTFSRIEPYTKWEQVFAEALRLWDVYVGAAQPKQVSRLAVRYINRMRVAGPAQLSDYLAAPPVLPPPIPQTIREFLSRNYLEDAARNASAVVIQALEPQVDRSLISILLDIDSFRDNLTLLPDDPSIPKLFESLRSLKNEIFFASITERTAEMYE
jgi:uncharacterized protein (TIGR04255 family)